MPLALPTDPSDLLVLVVAVLGSLLLGRLLVAASLAAVARGSGAAARRALVVGAALRPGIARRAAAAVLGLAAPAAALAPVAGAAPPVARVAAEPASSTSTGPAGSVRSPVRDAVPVASHARREVHVVRRGESLWSIARDHLAPHARAADVARAWPRWYAANRGVVGPDPSLIVPGQRLLAPGRRSAGTPTPQHDAPAPSTGTPVPSALSLDPDRR